jgi:hypothetical protein
MSSLSCGHMVRDTASTEDARVVRMKVGGHRVRNGWSLVIQTSFVMACIAPKCASVFKQTLEQGLLLQLAPHAGARVQKTRHFARHQRRNVVGQGYYSLQGALQPISRVGVTLVGR